jgi:hypothetical protein
MKLTGFLLLLLAFSIAGRAQTDGQQNSARDAQRAALETQTRLQVERERQAGYARLKAISESKNSRNATRIADANGRFVRFDPRLTDADKQAITIDEDILKRYRVLLKREKAGVVRLQNADICTPNRLVVAAVGGCPNNVIAKATAFSFRTGDYVSPVFSDVFFNGTGLSSTGAYAIGIFANLGKVDLKSLDMKSEGVRQLADFIPPSDAAEFQRQFGILRRGVKIGEFIYLPKAELAVGEVFVLRSVAYRANHFEGVKPRRINVMEGDVRADVIIVFQVETLLSDGSVILVWRELNRSPPPGVVLEALSPKSATPNKFLSAITH